MKPKFQIRPLPMPLGLFIWMVISPDRQVEHLRTFPEAIRTLDIWIEEYRCRIVATEKLAHAIARA